MTLHNSSFSKDLPTFQFAWDSTSLGLLKECPRKYFYMQLGQFAPRAVSVHLMFGLAYHASLEAYDHAISNGMDRPAAIRHAVKCALAYTWIDNKPWNSDDQYKNRLTLVRSVVAYLDHFAEDPFKTIQLANGKPAVELSFRFEANIHSPVSENILLTGHMDRLAELNGEIWVVDRKTTKSVIDARFIQSFNPSGQMTQYTFASQIIYNAPAKGVIIDAAQVLVGGTRFNRFPTLRTADQLTEWYNNTKYWIGQAAQFAERAHDKPFREAERAYPMNDKSCGNYGGCDFRAICAKDPKVREIWLQNSFKKKVWDPLAVRGDVV